MKLFLMSAILLLSSKCFSQDYYTLLAHSYVIMKDGKENKVNKSMVLTYNRDYSILYIEGEKNVYFSNQQYTRDLNEGQLHESYLSSETSTTPYGRYNIQIFHLKNQNIFEVVLPGVTFYAEHAELYSENGKVQHNPYVNNWKELLEKEEQRKNLDKQKNILIKDSIRKVEVKDSIQLVQLDSLKRAEKENELQSGNTYIAIDSSVDFTLNSIVEKKIILKKNEFIYTSWKILINKEGVITDAKPDETYKGGHIINFYITAINNALINQRVKPFVSQNGNKYPFYSNVYINLSYIAEKKRPILKGALKLLPMSSFF